MCRHIDGRTASVKAWSCTQLSCLKKVQKDVFTGIQGVVNSDHKDEVIEVDSVQTIITIRSLVLIASKIEVH